MNNDEFSKKGYTLVKNFISKELAKFLYEYLLLTYYSNTEMTGDLQVPGALSATHGDPIFETLLFNMHSKMEKITSLKLFPTYTYRRLYRHGNKLDLHKDRPSCEISVTIKLSDSGNYNWPIWMENQEFFLEDGDAVIYRGCDLEHWREVCEGPEDYKMGQVFLHYVDKNGPFSNFMYDMNKQRKFVFEKLKIECSL